MQEVQCITVHTAVKFMSILLISNHSVIIIDLMFFKVILFFFPEEIEVFFQFWICL